jgi:hypothetical protein
VTANPNSCSGQRVEDGSSTPGPVAGRLASPLLAALEATWAAIRDRHPQVPEAVIVLASGSVGAPRGALKLGHFAAMRWTTAPAADGPDQTGPQTGAQTGPQAGIQDGGPGVALPEVFVGGEGLARGAVDVLGTLLHEATHALAHVRGIQDCSRQGRYHNRRFADLAHELGLLVTQRPGIGWSDTHVPDVTRADYVDALATLNAAITLHRRAEHTVRPFPGDDDQPTGSPTGTDTGADAGPGSCNGTAARCGCGRRIRVTASVLALGPITCGLCGHLFTTTD